MPLVRGRVSFVLGLKLHSPVPCCPTLPLLPDLQPPGWVRWLWEMPLEVAAAAVGATMPMAAIRRQVRCSLAGSGSAAQLVRLCLFCVLKDDAQCGS
jgi:hypothetical protein